MDLLYMFDACVQQAPEDEVAQIGPRADGSCVTRCTVLRSQRLSISNRRSGGRLQEMGVVLLVIDRPNGRRRVALAGVDHEECQQRRSGEEAAKR